MYRMYRITIIIAFSFALLAACDKPQDTVAKVNDKTVTDAEFETYLKLKRLPAQNEKQREKALAQYVDRIALANAIKKHGDLDMDSIGVEVKEYERELVISRYFDQFLKDKVTDQAVLNYYNSNPEEFQSKRIRPAHILIRTDRQMDQAERQAKWTLAREVYSKAKSGEDFAELAKNYSEDKISGKKGGDLGWIQPGAVGEKFSNQVFSMEEGEISEPFETPFGFHVVKILEGEQVVKKPFEAVKGKIRYQLRTQAKNAELERLKKKIEIKITDEG